MDFNDLDEVVFGCGGRSRASDRAYVQSYRLIENYQSTWKRKPTRNQVICILRKKYRKQIGTEKFVHANAFWYDVYQGTDVWQVRYGFGEAYCIPDRLS